MIVMLFTPIDSYIFDDIVVIINFLIISFGYGYGGSYMLLPIEFQKLDTQNCLFVDVRSPAEFEDSTIYGAVNLALFTDEERKIIGTMYKHDSPADAKQLGVEIVSEKLPILYKEIIRLRKETGKRIVLFVPVVVCEAHLLHFY